MNEDKLLTTKQAAEFLGIETHTLYAWRHLKRYSLPVVKIGRLNKYRLSALNEFVENNVQ